LFDNTFHPLKTEAVNKGQQKAEALVPGSDTKVLDSQLQLPHMPEREGQKSWLHAGVLLHQSMP
jgi:hypothetical protein